MLTEKESIRVVRSLDAKNFMEGNEYCKLYVENKNIIFGVSTLHPGQKGDIDPGHEDAYEVFYVTNGRILCYIPTEKIYEELSVGDLILIPPKMPHQLINIGDKIANVVWAQAKIKIE